MERILDCDFKDCNQMLKSIPVINEYIWNEKLDFQSNLHEWFNRITFDEYKKIKKLFAELGVDFVYSYVPVGGSGSYETSEEEFQKFQEDLRQGKIEKLSNNKVFSLIQKVVSKEVLDAYKHCITKKTETCIADKPVEIEKPKYGLGYKIDEQGPETVITLWYVPYNNEDSFPIVDSIYIPDFLDCKTGCLKNGDVLKSEHSIVIKALRHGTGIILIDTNKGTISVPIKKNLNREYSANEQSNFRVRIDEWLYQKFDQFRKDTGFPFYAGHIACTNFNISNLVVNLTLKITQYFDEQPTTNTVTTKIDLNRQSTNESLCFQDIGNFCISVKDLYDVIASNLENPTNPYFP